VLVEAAPHPIALGHHDRHPRIAREKLAMPVNEAPVQGVPDCTPRALAEVAHLEDVARPAQIGLRRDQAAIGVLAHAVDVGYHDPVVGVDKQLHEPLVNRRRIDFAEQHEVAQDHQPFDVVTVGVSQDAANDRVDRFDAGRAVVEGRGQRVTMVPEIASPLPPAVQPIDTPHVLTPTDDLADKAFQRIERYAVGSLQGRVDHLLRRKQPHVQGGGEHGVEQEWLVGVDRILVLAELGEAMLQKIIERRAGLLRGHRVGERLVLSDRLGKLRSHAVSSLPHVGVGLWPSDGRNRYVARQFLAVLRVVAPFTADGPPTLVEQHAQPLPLEHVEIGEEQPLAAGGELFEKGPRREEVRIVEHRELDACRRQRRRQPLLEPVVARIDELNVRRAELRQHAGNVAGRVEFATFDIANLPLLPPEPVSEVLHRRAMQDQLLSMKPILRQQQRFLDQHANIGPAQRGVLRKQLVRVNQRCTHDGSGGFLL